MIVYTLNKKNINRIKKEKKEESLMKFVILSLLDIKILHRV